MVLKYKVEISKETLENDLKRLTNQVYKLLPSREEGLDWQKILATILEEMHGLSRLLFDQQMDLLVLLSKLEGLYTLINEEDFLIYRKTIFECLTLISEIKNNVT